jgi:hypothetical protein
MSVGYQEKALSGNVKIYKTCDEAVIALSSSRPVSLLHTTSNWHRMLFYENESNQGEVFCMQLQQEEIEGSYHGMHYWRWKHLNVTIAFEALKIKDIVVLLPKYTNGAGGMDEYQLY